MTIQYCIYDNVFSWNPFKAKANRQKHGVSSMEHFRCFHGHLHFDEDFDFPTPLVLHFKKNYHISHRTMNIHSPSSDS